MVTAGAELIYIFFYLKHGKPSKIQRSLALTVITVNTKRNQIKI